MIHLSDLEQALSPIESVGYLELTFEIDGHQITLRPLLPMEEIEARRYAQGILTDSEDENGKVDAASSQEFFRVFKTEIVAHALAQIDDFNLRDVEHVATGQETPNGLPVRVKRHVAVRNIIQKRWSSTMLDAAFAQYNELTSRIELNAEGIVQYDPSDLDSEIARVEERLQSLKQERSRRAVGDPNLMADQVATLAGRKPPLPEPPPAPAPAPAPEPPHAAPASADAAWADMDEVPVDIPVRRAAQAPPRAPLVPPRAPPPTQGRRAAPTVSPAPREDAVMDSFGDADSEEALLAEQRRFMEAKAKFRAEREAAATGRTPPHRRGGRPDLPGLDGGTIRQATPEELNRLGATQPPDPYIERSVEELSPRGRSASGAFPEVNQPSDPNLSVNPRFRRR